MSTLLCRRSSLKHATLHCICHYRQGPIYLPHLSHIGLVNNVKTFVWRTPCPSVPGLNLFFQTVPLRIVTAWPTANAPVMVWEPWTSGWIFTLSSWQGDADKSAFFWLPMPKTKRGMRRGGWRELENGWQWRNQLLDRDSCDAHCELRQKSKQMQMTLNCYGASVNMFRLS